MQAGRESSRLSIMFRQTIANHLGMHITDMECMDFLMQAKSATAGDLAKLTGLTTGAITGVIRRLEKGGFITHEQDSADKRKVIVKPVMKKLVEGMALYQSFAKDWQKIIANYSDAELALIAKHYGKVSINHQKQIKRMNRNMPP